MNRSDDSYFLLYIEPTRAQKSETPVDDHLTQVMMIALNLGKKGTADYFDVENPTLYPVFNENESWKRGHKTACGTSSDSHDYKLLNGMITNSLAPFYLRWYRDAIPEQEMAKVEAVYDWHVKMGFIDAVPADMHKEKIAEGSFDEEARVDFLNPLLMPKEEQEDKDDFFNNI